MTVNIILYFIILFGGYLLGKLSNFFKTLNFVNKVSDDIEVTKANTSEGGRLSGEHNRLSGEHREIVTTINDSKDKVTKEIQKVGTAVNDLKVISDKEEDRRNQLYKTPQSIQEVSRSLDQANQNMTKEFARLNSQLSNVQEKNESLRETYNVLVVEYNELLEKHKSLEAELEDLRPKKDPPIQSMKGPRL